MFYFIVSHKENWPEYILEPQRTTSSISFHLLDIVGCYLSCSMLGVPHSTSRRISNLDLVISFGWKTLGLCGSLCFLLPTLFVSFTQHYTYLNFICSFNNSIFLQGQGNILLLCHYTAQYWIHFKHSLCRVFIKLRQFLNSFFCWIIKYITPSYLFWSLFLSL